ncbi:MAG: tryptophan-rich sensory protein [Clostridia bacterium]|nr:tryptophan-rich sensory protein [Clostridia bacterium]
MDRTKKALINGAFFVITLAVNTLGVLGLINGLSQKEISDKYVTLITPSPTTFSIWSVIYSLLIISMVVMIVKKDETYYKNAIDKTTVLFIISCILNIAWIVTFSYAYIELSVLFILGLLITLALICMELRKIQEGKRFLLPLTFGLYTGWLFIATVVNIAASLVKLKWNGFGIANETWAIIMLLVAIALTALVLFKTRNAAFPLPIAWAYLGIYQFLKSPEGFKGEFGNLQTTAIVGMVVLIGMSALLFYLNRFTLIQQTAGSDKVHLSDEL